MTSVLKSFSPTYLNPRCGTLVFSCSEIVSSRSIFLRCISSRSPLFSFGSNGNAPMFTSSGFAQSCRVPRVVTRVCDVVHSLGVLIVGAMYATAKTKVEKLLFFDNQHNNVFAMDFIPSRISSLWRRC